MNFQADGDKKENDVNNVDLCQRFVYFTESTQCRNVTTTKSGFFFKVCSFLKNHHQCCRLVQPSAVYTDELVFIFLSSL